MGIPLPANSQAPRLTGGEPVLEGIHLDVELWVEALSLKFLKIILFLICKANIHLEQRQQNPAPSDLQCKLPGQGARLTVLLPCPFGLLTSLHSPLGSRPDWLPFLLLPSPYFLPAPAFPRGCEFVQRYPSLPTEAPPSTVHRPRPAPGSRAPLAAPLLHPPHPRPAGSRAELPSRYVSQESGRPWGAPGEERIGEELTDR